MKSYTQFKKQLLKDKEVRRIYEELGPEFELIKAIIEKRLRRGLTQNDLAKKIGTKQSAIARLESGTYNPTVSFLGKVAKALDSNLLISLKNR
ncbi:MAG: helix-turn-helix transcriptional regulator [bacterium]|nr:helix-turn-helix transcriptional regulator [bacterium]